jgi:hypothetical protein
MSFEAMQDVNWLAVLVATIAYFALGAIWYIPPVMGKRWGAAGGIDMEGQDGPNPAIFALTLVAYFIAGLATAMLATSTGTDTAGEGAVLGAVVGVGYAMTAAAVTAVYDRKPDPFGWFWINGVFNLIGLVAMGAIIGAWR